MAPLLKTRLFIVIWGTVEIVLFAGLIFGWASLVYVFKKDGYFRHLCNGDSSNTAGVAFHYENHSAPLIAAVGGAADQSTLASPLALVLPTDSDNVVTVRDANSSIQVLIERVGK